LASFLQGDGLPFAEVLSEGDIQRAFEEEHVHFAEDESWIYTPAVVLWAFVSQSLFKGEQRSCLAAVARVIVLTVAMGREPPAANSGAYCKARAKLPEAVLSRLTREVAHGCEAKLSVEACWEGRHVKLVDGTTLSMPDTPENQAAYPQQPQQKPGLGFPLVRMVVLLSLATAMLSGMALGPYAGKETSELALFRTLLDEFAPGDILLADRFYCSYFMIALLLERKVDFVVRLHQRRGSDFRRGERLGSGDHVVRWLRPAKPDWMDQATYDRMPESIEVREIEVQVAEAGFRVESLVVVTTLLDAKSYPKAKIAELYHARWLAELDIRAIKTSLTMDVLRCKTPEMVRKEIWACFLAYNLIRKTMLQAATPRGRGPRTLSFAAAMQTIAASWIVLAIGEPGSNARLLEAQSASLCGQTVGHRPNRCEPRAVKRRPKPHPLLTKPRAEARAELLRGKKS
jgi:hypothetical protein